MLDQDVSYFTVAATAGSLGRAAEQLGLTQPALSKAIQRLEQRLGVRLFDRTPRGALLTEAGRGFLKRCQTVASLMDDAVQEARDIGGGHAGLLKLGMSPASAHFVLKALFPRLRQERPATVLHLRTAFGDTLLEALQRKELGLAICPIPAELPPDIEAEVLYDDTFHIVCNDQHPLARQPLEDFRTVLAHDFAASGKQEFARLMIEQALGRLGWPMPRVVVEANSLDALVCIVSRSPLVTLIPRRALPPDACPPNLVWRPLDLPGVQRRIGLLRPRHYLSPIGLRAVELLREATQGCPADTNFSMTASP